MEIQFKAIVVYTIIDTPHGLNESQHQVNMKQLQHLGTVSGSKTWYIVLKTICQYPLKPKKASHDPKILYIYWTELPVMVLELAQES